MADWRDKFKVPWYEEIWGNVRGMFLVFRAAPLYASVSLLLNVFSGLIPATILAQMGRFMDAMTEAARLGSGSAAGVEARGALVTLALAVLVSQLIGPISGSVTFGLSQRFQRRMAREMMTAVSSLPGLAYFEDSEFRDKLQVTQWIGWAPASGLNALFHTIYSASSFVGMAVVAASFAAWVPILVLACAVPGGIASIVFESRFGMARWSGSEQSRWAGYYTYLVMRLESAKELRIFKLRDWARSRQEHHWLESMREAWKTRRRSIAVRLLLQIPTIVALSIAYMAILRAVFADSSKIGRFAAVALATVSLQSMSASLFESITRIRRSNFYLPVAYRIMRAAKKEPRLDVTGTRSATDLFRLGLRFEDVSFTYPGTERKVLDGLNLWIPSGASVALVGENGAGKTTLIKLLCRFYDPDEGRITLDGVDIRDLSLEGLRQRLAVIFQDFSKYFLPARENVGFGAVDHMEETDMLVDSAAKVGVLETIEKLPKGWDTPLAREFGGSDLSGGEWQRIALARAMMAQAGRDSDLLILDEPTASLDVRLENELYDHFAELSRGRTTLLVSHRFSTVRMAERIVFLENGKVVEDGSHDELMTLGGRYAQLYEMQASHFRMAGSLD